MSVSTETTVTIKLSKDRAELLSRAMTNAIITRLSSSERSMFETLREELTRNLR